MKKLTTRQIALNGVIAGLYAAVTLLTASISYQGGQFRVAEALGLLVALEPSLSIGLTLGCLISNIFSTVSALDIVVGTAATLLSCLITARIRRTWLLPLPAVVINGTLVGAMLSWVTMPGALFWKGFALLGAEVAIGEAVVLYLLGVPLYLLLKKSDVIGRLLRGEK